MNAENSHKSWRPLTTLSFKLNHVLGGTPPPYGSDDPAAVRARGRSGWSNRFQ